jgi:hypothetical protein
MSRFMTVVLRIGRCDARAEGVEAQCNRAIAAA